MCAVSVRVLFQFLSWTPFCVSQIKQGMVMKFKVNPNDCIGCGACEAECPEVFQLDDDISTVVVDDVPEDLVDSALAAEENCPADAISHK